MKFNKKENTVQGEQRHIVTSEGVKAIAEMPSPTDKAGMTKYLVYTGQGHHNSTTETTATEQHEHDDAAKKLKVALTNAPVLLRSKETADSG